MPEIVKELWFCDDCMIAEVNGDVSGISSEERLAEVNAGFDRLEKEGDVPVSANWDNDTEEGIKDFSSSNCDCCLTHLAGSRHRFAIFGKD